MDGFLEVILDGTGAREVVAPAAMLLLFTAGFIVVAAFKFRFEETKVYVA